MRNLKKKIEALERENALLKKYINIGEIEPIEEIIKEYQTLIAETKSVKEKYSAAVDEMNTMKASYKKEMDALLKQTRKGAKRW